MSSSKRKGVCFQYLESGSCRFGSKCKFSHSVVEQNSEPKSTQKLNVTNQSAHSTGRRSSSIVDHIDAFFADYPEFDYKPTAPIWTEFNRMCDDFDWDSEDYEMREARRKFKAAMVQQFNDVYGTDMEDLASWQKLCHVLNIKPMPEGLKQCRQRVRQTHVNLVDLVDTPRTGDEVTVFPDLKTLQTYTIENGKYFPKEDAYAGGLLRFLLREIIHSYGGRDAKKASSE